MNDDMRLRSSINLDELERQLREAATMRGTPPQSSAAMQDDPLAELARLVGQDQPAPMPFQHPEYPTHIPTQAPFKPESAQPEPRVSVSSTFPPYGEQSYDEPQYEPSAPAFEPAAFNARRADDQAYAPRGAEPRQHAPQAPAFELEQDFQHETQGGYPGTDPIFSDEARIDPALYAEPPVEKPRRTGLYILGAMLIVAGGGLGAAAYMRKDVPKSVNGAPPVIVADKAPVKVAPPAATPNETQNQNTQLFNRAAPDDTKKATVVASEEQPVDVNTVPRAGGATGRQDTASVSGEARRVKTVTVRPDGTIVEEGAPMRLPSSMSANANVNAIPVAPTATPWSAASASKPIAPSATTSASAPTRAMPPSRPENVSTLQPLATPSPAPTTQPAAPARTAVVAPSPVAPTPAPVAAAPAATADGGSGDYSVQLAAPGSEAEARDSITKLQRRFSSELGNYSLSTRRADVGSKTIYRVRVGGLSREEAGNLCQKLKAAGGDCFTAKN